MSSLETTERKSDKATELEEPSWKNKQGEMYKLIKRNHWKQITESSLNKRQRWKNTKSR